MTKPKLTQQDFPLSFGAFAPVDYVVVALPDEAATEALMADLDGAGFAPEDIVRHSAADMAQHLKALLPDVSGAAGFGSEAHYMSNYYALAEAGCPWLLVHAPETEQETRVAALARDRGAKVANKYNMLTLEELL
ncbi:hypothetical protein [Roseateles toxinivorans]|uniref:Heat induced stress protein YflT n=1 Tax=Roseateles toxinivorans TaxID=270368 RepID=A0A4R6QFU7_9BURK|nr:hypothetical protein [Roseateles toxinivorans]TDP61820.1 hypothetical protein DES47_11032 [Roseateles toxinivorans]